MKQLFMSFFMLVSVMFYAQTTIQPQNIEIDIVGEYVNLSFDSVPSAVGYRVESSNSAYGTFTPIGFCSTNHYEIAAKENARAQFYRVVALTADAPNHTELSDNTVVVDSAFQNAVMFITDSYIVLDRMRVLTSGFYVDQVLISSPFNLAPSGFMRKVTDVEEINNYVVLRTVLASLAEVADQVSVQSIRQLTADDIVSTEYYLRGVTYERSRNDRYAITYPFNNVSVGLGDFGNPSDWLVLDGDVSMNIAYLYDLDLGMFAHINNAQFQVSVIGNCNLTTSTTISGSATGRISILKHTFTPFPIPGTPLMITPELVLRLKLTYHGNGTITTSLEESYNYNAGIVYQNSQWIPFHSGNNQFQIYPPEFQGDHSVKFGIGPELTFKVCGVTGPYLNVLGGFETITDSAADPWKTGRVYLNGEVGFKVEAFILNISSGVFDIDFFSRDMFAFYQIKTPVIVPYGGLFSNDQEVSISCETPNVEIRYTSDGSDPTEDSEPYFSPFIIDEPSVIKARAFKEDYPPSAVGISEFIFKCHTPDVSPSGGIYQDSLQIELSCSTNNAEIRYTIDGSEPIESSTIYYQPFYLSTSCSVRAKAFKTGWLSSNTAIEDYVINSSSDGDNLLLNGDFSEESNGWLIVDFSVGSSHQIVNENGNKYVRFNHLYPGIYTGSWNALGQEVRSLLIPGRTYKVSVDYRLNASVYDNSFKIRFGDPSLIMHTSVISPQVDGPYAINDNCWHTMEETFTATATYPMASEPMLEILFDYGSVGSLCIDNVVLVLLDQ